MMRLALFIPLAVPAALLLPQSPAADRPNVVVVMTDDQGYGDVSFHGNPVLSTPNLDRLAAESVRLTDFHVAPMCTPTRGQLMTGLDALRNGAMNVSSGRTLLRRDLRTMADHFSAEGYRTGLFGKWHLGDNYPYRPHDRGFDTAVWFPSSHIGSVPDYWNNDYFDDTYWRNGREERFTGYATDIFFAEATAWMKSCVEREEPFLALIPTNAPHGPHFVPDRYRVPIAAALEKALPKLPDIPPQRREALVSFLAMIANIDDNMGRLEAALRETGIRDNTVVLFLTDNGSTMGPSYFNAGMKGGKVTLWEGGHRVPCFIRWPGGKLRPPGEIAELTQVQDLLPTLLELCGLPAADRPLDGTSLAGLLRGESPHLDERMLVVNYSRMPITVTATDNPAVPRPEGAAVLWKRWRLLENRELYDLATDPLQQHDVADKHPEVVSAMRAHLEKWWDSVAESVNQPQRIVIGTGDERPMRLTACEWFDVFVDQQRQVRRGERKNGVWHLEVAEPGVYEFELRRWPRESGLPLSAGCPPLDVTDGRLVEGEALPIAAVSLAIGRTSETRLAPPGTASARFRARLDAGPAQLKTAFLQADGSEICGAYYVYVQRLAAGQ